MMFSYFPYAASFDRDEAEVVRINVGLVGIALVIAPFVLVVVAFVSQNPKAPKRVLQGMGLLIPIGLSVGLLSPVLGATAAFGVGGLLALRPLPDPDNIKWRAYAIAFTILYTLVLLVLITPAGVFAGGLLPFLMLGFADEYSAWRSGRPT